MASPYIGISSMLLKIKELQHYDMSFFILIDINLALRAGKTIYFFNFFEKSFRLF